MSTKEGTAVNVIAVNVATQPRAQRTLNPFDLATEQPTAARKGAPRTEHNTRPADVGCVDWYLYPVNRKPRKTER